MTAKAGLKAGLIGIAVMLVVTGINHLLLSAANVGLSLAMCGVSMAIYLGIGMLGGLFTAPTRTPGKGAGAGAIAGVISGLAVGVVGYILVSTGVSNVLDSPQVQQAVAQGFDPTLSIALGAVCNPLIGAGMAAIGGAIFAAVKPD